MSAPDMTPEQQRICIAEACGWGGCYTAHGMVLGDPQPGKGIGVEQLPDYLGDLNAMHEAEKQISPKELTIYVGYLMSMTQWTALATAAQRAEAFLKAKNLWEWKSL